MTNGPVPVVKGPAPTPEALDGETLMLGPVPAWRLPVHQRGAPLGTGAPMVTDVRSATRPDEPVARPGVAPSMRPQVASALFPRGDSRPTAEEVPPRAQESSPRAQEVPPRAQEAAPRAEEAPLRAEVGTDGAAPGEPARFGWFQAGR
jgi:hypothetical protein